MIKIEQQAFIEFPKNLFKWASDPDQFDDLNKCERNTYIKGTKFVIKQLTDKLTELQNQHEPDNQEQEKITIKCNLLMEIIKELDE
jgi:predicted transcriptional regulator